MKMNKEAWLLLALFCLSGCNVADEPNRPATTCENGAIDAPEQCDGDKLNDQTCQTLGFAGGVLKCHPDICQFDTTGCFNDTATCGDGKRQTNEQCDGLDTAGATCPDGSPRACLNNCMLSRCPDMTDDMDDMPHDMNDMSPDMQSDMSPDMSGCAHPRGDRGVCKETRDDGQGQCVTPDFEDDERRCDGLDNDCDGVVDEGCAIKDVAIAGRTRCELLESGAVHCLGDNRKKQGMPPSIAFLEIEAVGDGFCGIRADNKALACWGEITFMYDANQKFDQLAASASSLCGIQSNKDVKCFGLHNNRNVSFDVTGPIGQIFTLGDRVYYLKSNKVYSTTLGLAGQNLLPPIDGVKIGVTSPLAIKSAEGYWDVFNDNHQRDSRYNINKKYDQLINNCGVIGTSLECWDGFDDANTTTHAIKGAFASLGTFCALKSNGVIKCFGEDDVLHTEPRTDADGVFVSDAHCYRKGSQLRCFIQRPTGGLASTFNTPGKWIAFGPINSNREASWRCHQAADATVECQSQFYPALNVPVPDRFEKLVHSDQGVCGLKTNQSIKCWGKSDAKEIAQPPGTFIDLAIGWGCGCAIDTTNKLKCWGEMKQSTRNPTPDKRYKNIVFVQNFNACALDMSQAVTCWGVNNDVTQLAPSTPMKRLAAGDQHVCGLTLDDHILCWGKDNAGQTSPPAGTYEEISCGGGYCCATNRAGYKRCWGSTVY